MNPVFRARSSNACADVHGQRATPAGTTGTQRNQRTGCGPRAPRGFTMVELLVTLVVLAILLALAAPNMSSFINNSRLRSSQGELVSALMLARSEATKRGSFVVVEAIAPVAGAEFSGGWQVFEDQNNDGVLNTGETIFRKYPALGGNQRFGTTGGVSTAAFNPRGFLKSSARVEFTLCGQTGQTKGYQITLEPVGLADVKEQSTCS